MTKLLSLLIRLYYYRNCISARCTARLCAKIAYIMASNACLSNILCEGTMCSFKMRIISVVCFALRSCIIILLRISVAVGTYGPLHYNKIREATCHDIFSLSLPQIAFFTFLLFVSVILLLHLLLLSAVWWVFACDVEWCCLRFVCGNVHVHVYKSAWITTGSRVMRELFTIELSLCRITFEQEWLDDVFNYLSALN